jgi:U3 small nucleolar RNA-associated protein 10
LNENILLTTLLCLLTSSFKHDENGWWQSPSRFGTVATNIVRLMPLSADSDVQESFFFDALFALTHGVSSQDHLKTINSQVLMLLRGESQSAKTLAAKCERMLTQDLGEEWLALLPEMLPVIQELLEDDSDDVVRETRRWIRAVEEASGESMESMLG